MKNTKRQTTPDAWMQLVLRTMGTDELKREIASGTLSSDELRVQNFQPAGAKP